MVIRPSRFNIYLLLAAALVAAVGCETFSSKSKKQIATLRVHLEAPHDPSELTEKISVLRASPISLTIEKTPFLNETDIGAATVIASGDEFILSIQLNQQGQRMLEQYSSANPQRRFAIRSQFRQGTNVFDRWLAAPLITRRISDGILSFSPDADREEADIIAKGWNKAAGYKEPKKKKTTDTAKDGGAK
jgi:preprotein translocase subunit SecD